MLKKVYLKYIKIKMDKFLFNTLLQEFGKRYIQELKENIPLYILKNLNPKFEIRDYQKEAFSRFQCYFDNSFEGKKQPIHLLYNMATGSGKTFVMASLILELYEKGYRNFLFFVNSTNIIEKTKDNFLNSLSSKYLFSEKIEFNGKIVKIKEVNNFSISNKEDININFTTIQALHTDLNFIRENGLSYEDFKDNKVVLLSDEAHHLNSLTKKKLNKTQEEEKKSWEFTVNKILNSNKENILLEFTATIDLANENIKEKYYDKIIFKYDLKEFRKDGYSKEVDILKSDMDTSDRILQALILSQYRLKVAEKNKIYCKPVILFKAQKTVKESEENLKIFNNLIKNLKKEDLEKIKNSANSNVIKKAFRFFEENNLSLDNLVEELKQDFREENCLSANDDKNIGKNQILLNTLEDKNNNIRAIFAVQKLNEGWDVLNLFDIVRLYNSRSNVVNKRTGKIVPGPQTISEAQLIGRGARYFPFTCEKCIGEDKFKRKFDNKNEEELKILETFYYHTSFDNLYITEIRQALIETGMLDEKEKQDFQLKLKDSFKKSDFYKQGVIYVNERKIKDKKDINSLDKVGIKEERFEFKIFTGKSGDIKVFDNNKTIKNSNFRLEQEPRTFEIKDIDKRIVLKAISRNSFYRFDNLQKYIGGLNSIEEFITSNKYLNAKKIDIYSSKEILENLWKQELLKAVEALLYKMETEIKAQETKYKGTKTFIPKDIQKVFIDKTIKVDKGIEGLSVNKEWFVFDKINATSEEIAFINLFEKKIQELEEKYYDIYLLRSERHFAIYSFDDGNRFEPDFVLFMKEKETNKPLTYQVFIEPKGEHLLEKESEKLKDKFLLQIKDKAKLLELNFGDYKLIGLPLYNKELENKFEKAFDNELL